MPNITAVLKGEITRIPRMARAMSASASGRPENAGLRTQASMWTRTGISADLAAEL